MKKIILLFSILLLVFAACSSSSSSLSDTKQSTTLEDNVHSDLVSDHVHDESHPHEEDVNVVTYEEQASEPNDLEKTTEIFEQEVIARNWEFSPNPIKIPYGSNVILHVKSVDVEHGISIPDFGISNKLIPGETVDIEFIANKKGEFTFTCNVYCGYGHSHMSGLIIIS
jgi:cytochrome c oxidase subunit 2